jgi:proteic killer suppression protein
MIKSWSHKGLKQFFSSGRTAGINPAHTTRLARQLRQLDDATQPCDMNIPGWDLHQLRGDMAGVWSVKINANWRLTFGFEGQHAVKVNYQDYH